MRATAERPEPLRRDPRPSLVVRVLTGFSAVVLLVYGMLALAVASLWGPSSIEPAVEGGPELLLWAGLPAAGALAALCALLVLGRPGRARVALLLVSLACLVGWTVFAYTAPD